MDHTASRDGPPPPSFWSSRYATGFLVLGAIATYFLLTGHSAHIFAALPFMLLLACPLMHVFMHGGHGGDGGNHESHDASRAKTGDQP